MTFHRVLAESQIQDYPLQQLALSEDQLRWLLAWLAQHYDCGPLSSSLGAWLRGDIARRPRLALTFDDATVDNYRFAKPILEAAGLRATFYAPVAHVESGHGLWHDRLAFALDRALSEHSAATQQYLACYGIDVPTRVATSSVIREALRFAKRLSPGERREWIEAAEAISRGTTRPPWDGMMTWEHLSSLAADGHEIGSHTMTHALLTQVDDATLAFELTESRRLLENRLGVPVSSFCFPDGDHDDRVVAAVRDAGYENAVTTRWGSNERGTSSFRLRRCDMVFDHVLDRFARASEARLAWRLSRWHPSPP